MPAPDTPAMTLAQLSDYIFACETIPLQARRAMRSAIAKFADICGCDVMTTIADPPVIRNLAAKAAWQLTGIGKPRWANIRSNVTRAMEQAGTRVARQRKNFPLGADWDVLLTPLAKRDRDELRRFAGWCSTLDIAPLAVTCETFNQFLAYLEQQSVQRNPRERAHVARRAWNRAIAFEESSFPLIPAPEAIGKRLLRWEDFPPSLRQEVDAYALRTVASDPLGDDHRPVKPVTRDNYLTALRRLLTHLAESGLPVSHFTSLTQVIGPAMVRRGCEQLLGGKELDDRTRQLLHGMVTAALNVARVIGIDDAGSAALRKLSKKVRFTAEGMNGKNRERLMVLEQPAVRQRLLRLPDVIAGQLACVKAPTVRQAQRMQMAVLLALLLRVPLRIRNAAELDLAATIAPPPAGIKGNWRIAIPRDDVKNKVAIDAELGERMGALLDRYIAVFRPRIAKGATSRLFPSQRGTDKGPSALSKQLARFVQRELGVTLHAHLMRHFAARLYLAAHPGDYEPVRRLLGHKNIQTTIRFYAGTDSEHAHIAYDALIEGMLKKDMQTREDVL